MIAASPASQRQRARAVQCGRLVLAFLVSCLAAPALGDSAYEVEPDRPISLRALLDIRLVCPGLAPSWRDRGPGKTRYGGIKTATGFDHVWRFALAQLALEPAATLPGGIRAYVDLNWAADIDTDGMITNDGWPRLVEGWLRKEWGAAADGWALQAGVTNPPFTPENTGPAWMPRYTLTPSALSSWLWEEGRVVGAEGEWWHETAGGTQIGALAGFGWGPDQMGILLAQRGWVLDDDLAGVNSTLPLPAPGKVVHVFDERDGRPALYVGANVGDPWHLGTLRLGYFDKSNEPAMAIAEVGNELIGPDERVEYTVIGDPVNVASRIEGLTKELTATILVSAATAARLSAGFELGRRVRLPIRGKAEPVEIVEVLGGGPR